MRTKCTTHVPVRSSNKYARAYFTGVPSKNKSSCMNTLLSYEPFSVFQDIEEENGIFLLIANGLYLNIKISVKLVFE